MAGVCVAQLQEAKNSLLSVGGTSPCQIMFGRNPEVPEDLLSGNPDVIVNSAVLHDPPASFTAKVRSVSRQKVIAYTRAFEAFDSNDKLAGRTALDSRPPTLRSFQNGEMVAVWRKIRCFWQFYEMGSPPLASRHLYGTGARQLLDCSSRKLYQSLGQPASISKSGGTRSVAPGGGLSAVAYDRLGFDEGELLR